jgi:hypothetical protein
MRLQQAIIETIFVGVYHVQGCLSCVCTGRQCMFLGGHKDPVQTAEVLHFDTEPLLCACVCPVQG